MSTNTDRPWLNRFAQAFNRTAIGAGILVVGHLLVSAYWLRAVGLTLGLVVALYFLVVLDS